MVEINNLNNSKENISFYSNKKDMILDTFKEYILINPEDVLKFVLWNNALDYIQKVTPIVKSYYPKSKYYLEYSPDPEDSRLSLLTLYIEGVGSLEDNLDNLLEMEFKLLKMDFYNNSFKINFSFEVC